MQLKEILLTDKPSGNFEQIIKAIEKEVAAAEETGSFTEVEVKGRPTCSRCLLPIFPSQSGYQIMYKTNDSESVQYLHRFNCDADKTIYRHFRSTAEAVN